MAKEEKFEDEIMSDEELDGVAGGNCYESSNDSRFLNTLNGSCKRYTSAQVFFEGKENEIEKAWATVGITAELDSDIDNKYFLNGKQITQEDARQHAMKVVGKTITEKDWK